MAQVQTCDCIDAKGKYFWSLLYNLWASDCLPFLNHLSVGVSNLMESYFIAITCRSKFICKCHFQLDFKLWSNQYSRCVVFTINTICVQLECVCDHRSNQRIRLAHAISIVDRCVSIKFHYVHIHIGDYVCLNPIISPLVAASHGYIRWVDMKKCTLLNNDISTKWPFNRFENWHSISSNTLCEA